jgi:hypothetical protein
VVWIVLAVGLITLLGASRESAESYTELYLAGAYRAPCGGSSQADAPECIRLQVGIVNRESFAGEYRLVAQDVMRTFPPSARALSTQVGEREVVHLELPAGVCSESGYVGVELHTGETTTAYRELRLSCKVLSAADAWVGSASSD